MKTVTAQKPNQETAKMTIRSLSQLPPRSWYQTKANSKNNTHDGIYKVMASSNQIKSNLSLYSLHYAEACNELAGPISASLRPGNTAPFEEMSLRWRAIGNTVSDLTGPRFEPQTSRSRDERVTARPQVEKFNCPIPSAKKFNLKVGFLRANLPKFQH